MVEIVFETACMNLSLFVVLSIPLQNDTFFVSGEMWRGNM